ncbi:MAG: ABC transporter ATP-binding protein [Clostridium sp.]
MEKRNSINIINLNKSFNNKCIFKNFNISFGEFKMNTIIGASGGGKTTLLNIISELEKFDSGQVTGVEKRKVSYVFQEDRLLPWETIEGNMKLALESYYSEEFLNEKIDFYLNLVGVKEAKNMYPEELSGGMKQRVNIARALGKPSQVILMDEPFKSLDYKTKYTIMNELKNIIEKEDRIVIFVTHDVDEAIFFGGKIFVFGGSPLEIKGEFTEKLDEAKYEIINRI